ncbi:hypothetical protein HOE04_02530 [archaeon]|jgi:sporulation protein YlmC with PRC-barrel domain|nr:hypothetical protein [archaeon]
MKQLKKTQVLFILILFITILFIQNISALTANSSSYSVSMFGTGMATATPSSTNYNPTTLTEAKGTTRNAEGITYTGNIGFFSNTSYHKTVSITSYTIYPTSAVQGSIIRLSISALNAQSTWAVLTLPNSTEKTISLTNNGDSYYTGNDVGTYTVTFYANSSSGSLASAIDTFEITSPTSTTTPSSGGGGGSTTIIEKCTYVWDCSSWSICSDKYQIRECKNTGNCKGIEGKPIEKRICSDALFDVTIKFTDLIITKEDTLEFNVNLIEQEGIEKVDVQIKYTIIDSKDNEIFSQIETKAIQEELNYDKEIKELKLVDGEYILRVDILYGNLQRAFAEQKFKIKKGELGTTSIGEFTDKLLIILASLIILLILIIFILLKKRKKEERKPKTHKEYKNKIKQNLKKIKSKNTLIVLAGFMLIGILSIRKNNITGFIIRNTNMIENNLNIFWISLILGVSGVLVFTYRKNIIEKIKTKMMNKFPKNSLKGLIKKKVYLEEGNLIGKVDEVFLSENKIDSLKIKLNKKQKYKVKGIIVKYSYVKNIGHIVIIDERILEKLNI